jgi:hypothetical protein
LLGLLLLLAFAAAAWIGVRGWLAKDHLEKAAALVPRLEQQALDGRAGTADLRALQRETGAARELTGDPVWSAAQHLPWVGDDLAAVRAASRAVDTVATRVVPPLLTVADTLDPKALRPKDGRIDLEPLLKAREPLHRADQALSEARAMIAPYVGAGARAGSLVGPVKRAVRQLSDQLGTLAGDTATGSRAADLLPSMLGAEGRRSYLVVFQNLAEARSLGGIAGAFAIVEADDGRLSISHQGTAGSFPRFENPVIHFTPGQRRLYQPQTGRFFQNVTQPMSFPVGAGIAQEMWKRASDEKVDGVIATDPVALSYVLRATGPVQLPTGERLTGDNAVRLLLRDVYDRYDQPAAQDAFFASAAIAVFRRLTTGAGDPAAMLDALARASSERRLLVWSDHAEEEKRLSGTVLEGVLPATEPSRPTVGVFFNDATASKMSYYLRAAGQLTGGACRPGGMRDLKLVMTMTSTAPPRGLPAYVTGRTKPYTLSTVVYLASPVAGGVVSVQVDGQDRPVNTQDVAGRSVAALTVDLRPGQSAEVTVTYVSPQRAEPARLRTSPTVTHNAFLVAVLPCQIV